MACDTAEPTARADAVYEEGRQAWPEIEVSRGRFRAHLARFDPELPPTRGGDSYLACACASGDSEAILAFERTFAAVLEVLIRRFAREPASQDELRQRLREHLFVGADGVPRIADYGGRGFLENWLRVTAVRLFLNARRGRDPARPGDYDYEDTLAALPGPLDIELDFLQKHYRAAFRTAFSQAVVELPSPDRALLRLQLVDGLTVSQLGAVLGVHRATAARRVARARDALVARTLAGLRDLVAIGEDDLNSLRRLIGSQLDLSLSRLFAEGSGRPP